MGGRWPTSRTTFSATPLLRLRDETGQRTDSNPMLHLLRCLLSGRGYTAPANREIIRQAEPDVECRARIQVGWDGPGTLAG